MQEPLEQGLHPRRLHTSCTRAHTPPHPPGAPHRRQAFSSRSCRSSLSIVGSRTSSDLMFFTTAASCSCRASFCSKSWSRPETEGRQSRPPNYPRSTATSTALAPASGQPAPAVPLRGVLSGHAQGSPPRHALCRLQGRSPAHGRHRDTQRRLRESTPTLPRWLCVPLPWHRVLTEPLYGEESLSVTTRSPQGHMEPAGRLVSDESQNRLRARGQGLKIRQSFNKH